MRPKNQTQMTGLVAVPFFMTGALAACYFIACAQMGPTYLSETAATGNAPRESAREERLAVGDSMRDADEEEARRAGESNEATTPDSTTISADQSAVFNDGGNRDVYVGGEGHDAEDLFFGAPNVGGPPVVGQSENEWQMALHTPAEETSETPTNAVAGRQELKNSFMKDLRFDATFDEATMPNLGGGQGLAGGIFNDGDDSESTGARKVGSVWQGFDGAPSAAARSPGGRRARRGRPSIRGFNFRGVQSPNAAFHREQLERYPGALPSEDEELWIIQRVTTERRTRPHDGDHPGCGALLARLPQHKEKVPVPLEHTDVNAFISAYIATVDVTQQYSNPFDSKIEAVYVFPLPQNAAINEFVMTVGERKIRGIIRDRAEAQQIYNQAKRAGKVASLLTQERPNVFTQKVANIEPGKTIDINIKYFHTLAYDDGWYEWVFPMVVGPRFNPPGCTDGIGALPRGGISGQATDVAYLAPHERSGHDISLQVAIDAGVNIERIKSVNHVIDNSLGNGTEQIVKLSPRDAIPNKDFVLRYQVAGAQIKSALLTHHDDDGAGYFSMMIYPPEDISRLARQSVEMIFVLDCSGSMNGKPIEQAKAAIKRGLRSLNKNDTFQVIRFSNNASQFGDRPVIASGENIRDAVNYVDTLSGGGGTMMIEGIKAALDFPHDENRLRFVCFMTDGFIGNEQQVLSAIQQKLGAARIFSFGVGSSPNRFLMNRMAKMGNGAVAYLSLNDSGADVMDHFFNRISHPALTDLKIDWGGMQVSDVYPERLPDLFVGRPVVVSGRFSGTPGGTIRVTGAVGDRISEVTIDPHSNGGSHEGLAAVWARTKIADLVNRPWWTEHDGDLSTEIKQLALNYNLMSHFTAFVAVDSLSQTAGDFGTTIRVPVPTPDGVKYETTVAGGSGS